MTHSPEPWVARDGNLLSAADTTIVSDYIGHAEDQADADRIVACVNACRGLSTSELAQATISLTTKIALETARRRIHELEVTERNLEQSLVNMRQSWESMKNALRQQESDICRLHFNVTGSGELHLESRVGKDTYTHNWCPEPWKAYALEDDRFCEIDHDCEEIVFGCGRLTKEDADRIVACVNFCAGRGTDEIIAATYSDRGNP